MYEIHERLLEHGLDVSLTDEVKRWLAEKGYDPQFGARPLRRVIQRYVESPLSVELLRGKFADGAKVRVDLQDGALTFEEVPVSESVSVEATVEVDA